MLKILLLILACFSRTLWAQEAPASPILLTLGPIDGESDAKTSVITMRFETKPSFEKPKVEAFGSFIQVTLPHTMVPKPGNFVEANSPYIRKMAAFQLDEQTAGLRLFTTKEAAHLLPAFSVDILENRVVVILDHAAAEKSLLANFDGVPVEGGPSSEEVLKRTEIRNDVSDPISAIKPEAAAAVVEKKKDEPTALPLKLKAAKKGSDPVPAEAEAKSWSENLDQKLIAVTIFVALMLVLLIGLKSWKRVASKKWPLAPTADYSLKTLATHAIGPKQKISVVQVGGEQILIGVSPDSINFLTSLKKTEERPAAGSLTLDRTPAAPRTLPAAPKRNPSPSESSSQVLRGATKKTDKLPEPGSSVAYGISDEGVKNYRSSARADSDSHTVDDVTKLIRKKLRDLPKV